MPDFDKLLQATLTGVNTLFEKATTDLGEMVVAVSKSVEAASKGKAKLELARSESDAVRTVLDLRLLHDTSKKSAIRLDRFAVPSSGYPIFRVKATLRSPSVDLDDERCLVERLDGVSELEKYFTTLASSKDSPLVIQLAFLLRSSEEIEELI